MIDISKQIIFIQVMGDYIKYKNIINKDIMIKFI